MYSRKRKRWERAAGCGRVIWSKRSRHWLSYNLAVHWGRCWKCHFLQSFSFEVRPPDPSTVCMLRTVIHADHLASMWTKGPVSTFEIHTAKMKG